MCRSSSFEQRNSCPTLAYSQYFSRLARNEQCEQRVYTRKYPLAHLLSLDGNPQPPDSASGSRLGFWGSEPEWTVPPPAP